MNQGIRQTQQVVQPQTIELAQEYFGCSVEMLNQQLIGSRDRLGNLPRQVPYGQEASFRILFQELMDNYATIDRSLNEARENEVNLDTAYLSKQRELNATDTAKREAKGLGVDITGVEGTGYGGLVTIRDVLQNMAEA